MTPASTTPHPSRGRRRRRSRLVAGFGGLALATVAGLAAGSGVAVGAPTARDTNGAAGTLAAASKAQSASFAAAAPSAYVTHQLNGGYVTAGVSLRNRGSGIVKVKNVPKGATVSAAYLYWNILGNTEGAKFKKGFFQGLNLTGTKVGSGPSPCWTTAANGYAYRANVTSKVTGNGTYQLSGFASGVKDGTDPWTDDTPPLAEGATVVVVYKKASYPLTRVIVQDGYSMVSSGSVATNIPFGFAASNPVGEVRTTFIGGDGQDTNEPASTFNGVGLSIGWDGSVPPNPPYSHGNLWDNGTASVGAYVDPGDTFATATVAGGPDCLTWVAQVTSIGVHGNADTDGDKLLDGWEANGLDADNNGTIDVDLPAMGASPVHKDLFVEMDHMGAQAVCPCHLPLAGDLDRIRTVYGSAPVTNPDGVGGIRIHLDAGPARGAAYNLGGGNLVPFDADLNPVVAQFNAIKAAHFNPLRAKVFHYMIWAHGYDGGSSSGNAFAIPNDSFVVTLGLWPGGGSSDAKVGTFVHELGHDLGQRHGGDDHANYEPNYLSVMNYAFQVVGVPKTSGARYFGYSDFAPPALDETHLVQDVGLNTPLANTYRTSWICPGGSLTTSPGTANGPLDWNCNGPTSGWVASDINGDGVLSTLHAYDNWANIVFGGGAVGGGVSPMEGLGKAKAPVLMKELTAEEAHKH